MNLRKDAWIAVSLAGAVLLIAGVSTRVGRPSSAAAATKSEIIVPHDGEVLRLFEESQRWAAFVASSERSNGLAKVRQRAIDVYHSRPMQSPLDLYRIGSVLETSENPKELALAHKLSVQALAGGVQEARLVVLSTQDRLLLSLGQPQRYGTQQSWLGTTLTSKGEVNPVVPPVVRAKLGLSPMASGPVAAE